MSKFDNLLFIRSNSSGLIFIIIYVDDLVVGGEHLVYINKVKMLFSGKFEMKDMNKLHYFKGIEVIRAGDGIMLSQRHYILNLLFKFGMTDHVPISTPFDRNLKMHTDSGTPCEPAQYQQIIGSLICLPVANSGKHCAKWVLRYVRGTMDWGIFYATGVTIRLVGYTDSDWTDNVSDRCSTSEFAFSLESGAISWSSKKQPKVALSSTEAEYKGAVIATYEAIWLKQLPKDLNESIDKPVHIYYDNQISTQVARNPVFHART